MSRPHEARPDEPRGPLGARIARALLGVPLFFKILLANALIAAVAGGAALAVAHGLTGGRLTGSVLAGALVFVAATLVLGAVLNAAVIRLALSPLAALTATAERVRRGGYGARAPVSPLADRSTARLIRVFNRMLDAVEAAQARQRELALRVLRAEERERARIAHELYAGTAQTLAGALVRLRLAHRRSEATGGAEPASTEAAFYGEIRGEVARALDEIRDVARRLRPPELDELGVRAALEAHARTFTGGRGPSVVFRGSVPESSLSRDAALALFRIVQEAVTNAVLHSGASRVQVAFTRGEDGLSAEVTDDGRGFDVRDLLAGAQPRLGLTGMQERAVYVGGTFSVDSVPGGGTTVRARVPWARADEPPAQEPDLREAGGVKQHAGAA